MKTRQTRQTRQRPTPLRGPLIALLAAAALSQGCVEPRIDKPAAPDTTELTADYAGPMGEIESATMEPMLLEVEETVSTAGGVCGWEGIDGLLCADAERCNAVLTCKGLTEARALAAELKDLILEAANSDEEEVERNGDEVLTSPFQQSEGYATLRHRCAGHGETPTLDEANGDITMTAGFTNLTLDPVIWADFDHCQFRVVNARFTSIELTGRLLLVLSDEQVGPETEIRFLTAFDFQIETELGTLDIASSFLIDPDATRVLILIRRDEGNILFFSGVGGAGFITQSGEYLCNFTERRCVGTDGREVVW